MKPWSIAGRLTRLIVTMGVAISLVVAGISSWFLRDSLLREIDSLAVEEINEMSARYRARGEGVDSFHSLAAILAAEHRAHPLTWRVWNQGTQAVVWEYGSPERLAMIPTEPTALGVTTAPATEFRWRNERLPGGLVLGVLVDGSWNLAEFDRFLKWFIAVLAAASIVAVTTGIFFARRLGGHLENVALQARAAATSPEKVDIHVEDAPSEIDEIAQALCEVLASIRSEAGRARMMAAGLAHELRSPIQNLMAAAEVSLMRERDSDHYKQLIESQFEELRDLARVVDNLVVLSSPSETVTGAVHERFDLGQEAQLRMDKERKQASIKGVSLELKLGASLQLEGDREALLLALRNLVGNAIHWSQKGSVVRVSIAEKDDEDRVEILVDDAGPGIPLEKRKLIFEPFNRGGSSSHGRIGYGLGLAIAKMAVHAQGGTIDVCDAPSGGARFRVIIKKRRA